MTPSVDHLLRRHRALGAALALVSTLMLGLAVLPLAAVAQGPASGAKPAPEQGVRWQELKPAQQTLLKPLEREWPGIGAQHKQKWIEMSGRFPTMSPPEQARVQERMAEWARLTPQQRSQARLHFQEAKQLPATDRKARWDAYQALSPEQKQQLAARAGADKPGARESQPQAKSNIVPNPALTAQPKVIAPVVVQARPGVTTSPITKRPTPPAHQQTGLPKIAATPGFVDKATLLPQRGPQGAAVRSVSASTPEAHAQQ